MKRTTAILAGLAIGAGIYLASHVWAQPAGTPTAAPLRTRVALINMVQILKNYTKFQNAEADLKARIQLVEKDLEPKKGELLKMRNEYATCNDSARRDQLERDVKRLAAAMQEMEEDARKQLGKVQGEMAVQIYKEVEDAVRDFARVNDIEMVLHYNDAAKTETTLAEFYAPGNVQRKMTSSGLMPMYIDPRMDITAAVTQVLNSRVPSASAPVGGSH